MEKDGAAGSTKAHPAEKEEQICRNQTTFEGFMGNHGERAEPQQRLGGVTMARA